MLGNRTDLCLEPDGRLHEWPPADGRAQIRYAGPRQADQSVLGAEAADRPLRRQGQRRSRRTRRAGVFEIEADANKVGGVLGARQAAGTLGWDTQRTFSFGREVAGEVEKLLSD